MHINFIEKTARTSHIDLWIIWKEKHLQIQKDTSAYLDTPYMYSNRIKGAL